MRIKRYHKKTENLMIAPDKCIIFFCKKGRSGSALFESQCVCQRAVTLHRTKKLTSRKKRERERLRVETELALFSGKLIKAGHPTELLTFSESQNPSIDGVYFIQKHRLTAECLVRQGFGLHGSSLLQEI